MEKILKQLQSLLQFHFKKATPISYLKFVVCWYQGQKRENTHEFQVNQSGMVGTL
jgi:hypothetical protein